jgi:predicted phage terminase large subunit-like protein
VPFDESEESWAKIVERSLLRNRWIAHRPTEKQFEFLYLRCHEALYGGAAGGGKSDALLMGAAMFVDVAGYSAIIFRRSFSDLMKPSALIDRAHQWWSNSEAAWDHLNYCYNFPSGAKISFGYLDSPTDKYHHQSAEYQFIGFDEVTQHEEGNYTYMFSRLRRLRDVWIPLRMRAATNPGGVGHEWVYNRFIVDGPANGRVFIPAKLDDNPFLDKTEYEKSLMQLDPVTRQRLRDGDWTVRDTGNLFRREWFTMVNDVPSRMDAVRYWDLAATAQKEGADPDYTAGVLMAKNPRTGLYYIIDVKRKREAPAGIEELIRETAEEDSRRGLDMTIYMEQDRGSAGINLVSHYSRDVLSGFVFYGNLATGPKGERVKPFSAACTNKNVNMVSAGWNRAYTDELEMFPQGSHDDQVDASSGAFEKLQSIGGKWGMAFMRVDK